MGRDNVVMHEDAACILYPYVRVRLGPPAQGFFKSLADVACSTGAVDRGSWLRIAQQYVSCAFVGGVALCSVAIIRVKLKVLGKTFVMVLVCHLSECG